MKRREIPVAVVLVAFFMTLFVQYTDLAAPLISGGSYAPEGANRPMELSLVIVDVIPPVTTADLDGTPGINDWYYSNVTVTLDATDDLSGIYETWYSIARFQWDLYTGPFNVSQEGITNLYFYSIDGSDNTESLNVKEVKIDKEAPITGAAPSGTFGDNDWFVSDVAVELYAFDAVSGVELTEYSRDNLAWLQYSQPLTITDEGLISLYYKSTDFAGIVEEVNEIILKIDKTAPNTTIHLAGNAISDGVFASDVTVSFTAVDDESGVVLTEYSLDGILWNEYEGEFVVDWEGETSILYRSNDEAGHVEDYKTETIQVVKGAPETVLVLGFHYPVDDTVYITASTTFTLVVVNDGSGDPMTYYRFNSGDWTLYEDTFVLDGDDGSYTIEFYSVDSAGASEEIQSESFVLVSLEANSFLSRSAYPSSSSNQLASLDIHFTKKGRCGFKLVSRGHWLWYHVEIENNWPISVEEIVLTPTIPDDFKLSKLIVWEELDCGYIVPRYLHKFRKHWRRSETRFDKFGLVEVSFDGESVVVKGLPEGRSVFFSFLVKFSLKGAFFQDYDDFTVEEYLFSAHVMASSIVSAETSIGLIEDYDATATLEIVNHGLKGKRWGHKNWRKCSCWKFRFKHWKR
ncbi:MAG: OmpL47-type beta-barrel domain-containing protein [Candidatus Thorarchaeota archaeon]